MPKQQQYKIVKAAFAALLFFVFSAVAFPSFSASLGRLTVLSSLGQPLRAEVELLDVSPEELSSLNAGLAPVGAYRLSGMDYSPLLQSLKIGVEKDGERNFVSIRSVQPINEPYIGLLLELVSGSDRKGNEYVIMLDPEEWTNLRSAPLSSAAFTENLSRQQRVGRRFSQVSSAVASPSTVLAQQEDTQTDKTQTDKIQSVATSQKATKYQVSRGDSLSKIANRLGYRNISLEQMLVALYRNNPDAFLNDNMNLLKEGTVLSIPDITKEMGVSRQEAQKIVKLHAVNFREYSLKLAELAQRSSYKTTPKTGAVSEGKITTKVKEQPTPVNQSPDRLELSKAQSDLEHKGVTTEEKIAIDKAIEDTNQRIVELEKNVNELRSLLDVVSNKGKAFVDPAEATMAAKKLAEKKKAQAGKKETDKQIKSDKQVKVDDKAHSLPVLPQDEKNVPSSDRTDAGSDQIVSDEKDKIVQPKENSDSDAKAQKETDEDGSIDEDADDEDEEDEKELEKNKKVGFLQNLQSNRTWHIAIGGIVALLILIVLVVKMMGRKKTKPQAAKAVKASSLPKEKPVEEDINPHIISAQDFLENLPAKEMVENENNEEDYRFVKEDETDNQQFIEEDPLNNEDASENKEKEIQELTFASIEAPVLAESSQFDKTDDQVDLSQPEAMTETITEVIAEETVEEIEENIQSEEIKEEDVLPQTEIREDDQIAEDADLAETSLELNLSDINLELDEEENVSEPADSPETDNVEMGAKLELALAYINMKDADGARELLEEVIVRGTPQQVQEAEKALQSL